MFFVRLLMCFLFFISSSSVFSASIEQREINQREQDKARELSTETKGKDVHSDEKVKNDKTIVFPEESDCLTVKKIVLKNDEFPHRLYLKQLANQGVGRCLGFNGVIAITTALQNRLISYGYITTRVDIPEQDLSDGTLIVNIIPGVVDGMTVTKDDDSYVNLYTTFPLHKGSILNLRDIEQGLENMQRVPGAQTHIRLLPGENEGGTDIDVKYSGASPARVGLWMDDSGSRYTGRYLMGGTLYLDNPSGINDNFLISSGGNFHRKNSHSTDNRYFYYSAPFGYWLFDIYGGKAKFEQTISGKYIDYRYRGQSNNLSVGAKRIISRGSNYKTSLNIEFQKKRSRNWIEDTELETQYRNTSALKASLKHHHYLEWGVVDGAVSFQRNMPWFSAQSEEKREAVGFSPQARIATLTTGLTIPFALAGQSMSYQTNTLLQVSPDRLTPQEKFAIGNRWSGRGFDGEYTLNASQGFLWSNTLNLNIPSIGQQFYLGADYGRVMGVDSALLSGKQLIGGVVGINGWKWNTGYNLFVGTPLYKPDDFITDAVTLGFSLNWQY